LKLECVLLGLIYLHPSVSGYELKTIIKKSTGYFFSASLSQIYPALKNLASDGLITYEVEPLIGKQDRKVYSITSKGREILITWLREPLELSQSLDAFQDFLLKLTCMGILDNDCVLAYLKTGLNHFKAEKMRVSDNHLENEKAYLNVEPAIDARYIYIWSHENDFLLDDLDRKIQWIEHLIEGIQSQIG
jgi:DNA-binding PadR family transcriptional regulator